MSYVPSPSFKPPPAKAALGSGETSGTSASDAPSGDESSTWILSLSKPYQYGILALFALYAPSAIGQGPLFEPYLQLLLFVSLIFGSLLISTTNLAGPLRYAYHNYKSLIEKAHPLVSLATAKVTAWAPLPFLMLALLPWFRTWFFMGAIPLTWQFVREEHQRAVSRTSNSVNKCCSKTEVAANRALSDAAAAERYEHDARKIAAVAAKEALLERHLKFQSSARDAAAQAQTAWGALAIKARTVATVVDKVTADMVTATDAAQKALKLLGEVRHLAAKAKTAAEEGRMTDAEDLVWDANGKLKIVEEESSKAATANKDARIHARDVYITWQSVREEHQRAINDVSNDVDECYSKAEVAANKALSDAAAVERYEHDARKIAAVAAKEALLERHLKFQSSTRDAAAQAQTAGGALAIKARTIATVVDKVTADMVTATDAAQKAFKLLGEVRHLAAKAKTAAEEGRMTDADGLVRDANGKLTAAEEESKKAAIARKDAKSHARDVYITWQFVCEEHQRAVNDVSNSVDEYCLKAEVAANKALSDAAAAERYEHDARKSAAVAAKEALLEQNIRVTDFYDESSVAWAALDRFQSSAQDAAAAASVTLRQLDGTNALAESIGKEKFDPIYAKFLEVTGRAKDLTLAAKVAKDRAENFKNAATQAQTARGALATRSKTVATMADNVIADVVTASDAAQKAVKLSGEVRHLAARAKTAAEEGRITDAEDLVRDTESKLKTAEEESIKAATARKDARAHVRNMYRLGLI